MEEIKNLRLELKTSNESIKTLSNTVKVLSRNCACKHKPIKCSSANKGKTTEAKAKATFRKGERVKITNKIKKHIRVATDGDRSVTE